MSTDLKYLAFTAILTASLWIPYVVAQVTTNGALKPQNYLDPTQRPLPLWGKRADRTDINAVETFAPFAALVIVVHLAGKANAMTAFWAMCIFGDHHLRVRKTIALAFCPQPGNICVQYACGKTAARARENSP
jgi:uncharacterized MAPEG superfamily protein